MRMPVGVVGAITPWNYPLGELVRKLAPALAAGNTVVVKPTEVAPLTPILFARIIDEELGLPPGVFNLVSGGPETGRHLVRSTNVDLITMTGHRDTGKSIMADAAPGLTRVLLELGGKAPAIVLADAPVDHAVSQLLGARVANTGQVCTSPERVYLADEVHDEFVEKYLRASAAIRVGDPWSEVDIGPLVNRSQHEKATAAVRRAVEEGATLSLGGGRPDGPAFDRGFWFAPTVLIDVDPATEVMREEVFAPVTPITRVGSLDEALQLANDSRYGLAAYIFTSDYRTAMRAANETSVGEIYLNRTNGESVAAYHSGWRESGLGGADGKHGALSYTQIKTVYHRYGPSS
jgi:lactaldehyde dehydrogenase/glycolaldehyde dehydrogenase